MVALLSVIGKYKCYCSHDVEYEVKYIDLIIMMLDVIVESVLLSILNRI